ncbi:uncharacterized protein LOC127700880 isoform X3 [Mytilus californianus]|uniref:uncharacterized protein LOC127700880 isoform X1 n=1 Tax=Mytilus californianus TaxID=6549 RepID=UPI002246C928|nr:uncharacterized protein LOC127700880 isoform X1 [Mytilus californianus]XP_052060541.1 uncharacterized protein LOC127700880 isoform X2 [Mytilus californianus]XP_052060542.1 uncharacterized protein LOC127700880 isoform X3 [Mytilus californianus]
MKMHQHQIILIFFLINFTRVISVTHYCQNGNTQTISGETSGTIRTVLTGENSYDNNLNCGWVIDGGLGKLIQLSITHVNLQLAPSYSSCGTYDHLSIMDGDATVTEAITSICGERNPYEVLSSGRYLYLKFYSNDKNFYDHSGITVNFQIFNENECPPDWTNLDTTDQCYRIRQSPVAGVDWNSAYDNCMFSQANLAIISHHEVFDNLRAHAQNVSVASAWIGLTDIETEGKFKWLNNSYLTDWIRTEGNNDDSDCAIFNFHTQKFQFKECERDKHLAVCQRNKVNKTTIFSIPVEKEKENTEAISLRWQIILGISGGVIIVIICFALYCKFHRTKPTSPGSENNASRSSRYQPQEPSYTHQSYPDRTPRRETNNPQYNNLNQTTDSPPPYADIPFNNTNSRPAVHINPQINLNVTVNSNGDQPPSYTFSAPTV